jgi:hypothetical protein
VRAQWIFVFFWLTLTARAADVTLLWSPSADTNVIAYTVYYGPASGVYTNSVECGYVTGVTLSLDPNSIFFFVVTATDGFTESDPSNELEYTTPVQLGIVSPPFIDIEALASCNLTNWHGTNWHIGLTNDHEFFQFAQPTVKK